MSRMRTFTTTAVVAAALMTPVITAAPAFAQGSSGRPGVTATGACTAGGTWKLSAEPDDGSIEVEFEVDTNVAGQTFAVRATDGPTVVFAGRQTAAGRSGLFTVQRLTADRAGTDTIRAVARRAGNTCTGVVRL